MDNLSNCVVDEKGLWVCPSEVKCANRSCSANGSLVDVNTICQAEEAYLVDKMGPPRSPMFVPVCLAYLAIFVVGVVGNLLTCSVIARNKMMWTPTNYYLFSLAVSDLLVLLLGMPLELYELWQNYPFLLGEGGCYFKTFLFETVCLASILNVTALSMERYIAVVHPLRAKYVVTRTHAKRVILLVWGVSVLCALPNTSLHGIQVLRWPCAGNLSVEIPESAVCTLLKPLWVYNLIIQVTTLLFFVLPMLTITAFYMLIGLRLRRERLQQTPEAKSQLEWDSFCNVRSRQMIARHQQVTKMLCEYHTFSHRPSNRCVDEEEEPSRRRSAG